MRVLVITGDRLFKPGHPRFDLQASAVNTLEALYWGPGAFWASPKGESFDIVSTQDPFFRGLVGLIFARRFKAKCNVQVHADLAAQSFLKRLIARFVLRHADSIRVVSEKTRSQVETYRTHARITVLPIFIEADRFRMITRTPSAEPLILWVGRFEDEKDPARALHVLREVRKKGIDATLTMLGAGALQETLARAARGLPVTFPGWKDPAPYLERAHVVLSTSKSESYGASIIEALAAGVPVVAPDVGVAREAGAIVVPREHLADAVAEVLLTRPSATLAVPLFSKEEWAPAWRESLI